MSRNKTWNLKGLIKTGGKPSLLTGAESSVWDSRQIDQVQKADRNHKKSESKGKSPSKQDLSHSSAHWNLAATPKLSQTVPPKVINDLGISKFNEWHLVFVLPHIPVTFVCLTISSPVNHCLSLASMTTLSAGLPLPYLLLHLNRFATSSSSTSVVNVRIIFQY